MSTRTLLNPHTNSILEVPADNTELIDLLVLQGYGLNPVVEMPIEAPTENFDGTCLENNNHPLIDSKNELNSTIAEEQTMKHTKENISSILQDFSNTKLPRIRNLYSIC